MLKTVKLISLTPKGADNLSSAGPQIRIIIM